MGIYQFCQPAPHRHILVLGAFPTRILTFLACPLHTVSRSRINLFRLRNYGADVRQQLQRWLLPKLEILIRAI